MDGSKAIKNGLRKMAGKFNGPYAALPVFAVFYVCCSTAPSWAQSRQEITVRSSAAVLQEVMETPLRRIPRAMLADAHGVAIIPGVIKGGFVIGARHGRGVLVVRDAQQRWHAPVFISLTGGNIGWQAGVQSSDIVLVFKTRKSVQGILNGTLTLGADAAAAAGPVGRQGSIATDGRLDAEIYSYSRSRGLFAGVSIDGSVIRIDRLATGNYYGPTADTSASVPLSALRLTEAVAAYAGSADVVADPLATATPAYDREIPATPADDFARQHALSDEDYLREQLSSLAPELYALLDQRWRSYLALPASVFTAGSHPPAEAIATTLARFDGVAADPRFRELAGRPEFQSVYGLLKHYRQAFADGQSALELPPPPGGGPVPATLVKPNPADRR